MKYITIFLLYVCLPISSKSLIADAQKVYGIASKNILKITALDGVNNTIRYGYGVPIGKSKCIDTNIDSSLENSGFENSNKFGTDILTTFQAVLSASRILVEKNNGEKTEAAIVYINSEKTLLYYALRIVF